MAERSDRLVSESTGGAGEGGGLSGDGGGIVQYSFSVKNTLSFTETS